MAKMHKVTDKANDLLRDKIACSARGIKWRCDELTQLAMYPNRILSQIKDNIREIKDAFKNLQDEMNEPPMEYMIEEIARSIMCLSIRAEETTVTSAYLKEVEAGVKRILRLIKEAREENNDK